MRAPVERYAGNQLKPQRRTRVAHDSGTVVLAICWPRHADTISPRPALAPSVGGPETLGHSLRRHEAAAFPSFELTL